MTVTIFSFGYWGWGNATEQLVLGIDAVERARGFAPPIFVDIRIRRTGRAKGFVGEAFCNTVGNHRYRWIQKLGNAHVSSGEGGIKIKEPAAAGELLELALDASRESRRVLFYCACDYPWHDERRWCHRDEVTDLLRREAIARGREIEVVEWPGGEPIEQKIELSPKMFSAVMRGRKSIPLDDPVKLADVAGFPWASIAKLESNGAPGYAMVGPARYAKSTVDGSGWYIPVVEEANGDTTPESLRKRARQWREERGLEPRNS